MGVGIHLGIGLGYLVLHIVGCCIHHALRSGLLLIVVHDGCNLFIVPLAKFFTTVTKHNVDGIHRRHIGYPAYSLFIEHLCQLCLSGVSLINDNLFIVRLLCLMALLVALVYAVREKAFLALEVLTTSHVCHHSHIIATHLQEITGIVHGSGFLFVVHATADDRLQQFAKVFIVAVVYLLLDHLPVFITEHDGGTGIRYIGRMLIGVVACGVITCVYESWSLHQADGEHHASPNIELCLGIEHTFVKIFVIGVDAEIVVTYEDGIEQQVCLLFNDLGRVVLYSTGIECLAVTQVVHGLTELA